MIYSEFMVREILLYLSRKELAAFCMVSKAMFVTVQQFAEETVQKLLQIPENQRKMEKKPKMQTESWLSYLEKTFYHIQRIFVHYTVYNTGAMRAENPQWAFGEVDIDFDKPHKVILPNRWQIGNFRPWRQKPHQQKRGEWILKRAYEPNRMPKALQEAVKKWTASLHVGSTLTVAVSN